MYTLLLGGLLVAIVASLGMSALDSLSGGSLHAQETTNAPRVVDGAVDKARDDATRKGSEAAGGDRGAAVADQAAARAKERSEKGADHAATADANHGAAGHGDAKGEHGEAHGDDHGGGGGHADPVAPILIVLFVILLAAKLGGDLFERLNQPSVLGELVFGVLLGNVLFFVPSLPGHELFTLMREGTAPFQTVDQLAMGVPLKEAVEGHFSAASHARMMAIFQGSHGPETVSVARIIDSLSRIGVIILLFMVGLESNFRDMMKVGVTSLLVALVGVAAPFALGYGVSAFFFADKSSYVHMFIGATLCATSVGITARVFKDLKKLHTTEAKIILGAAVIDDVLGLIILAVVAALITSAAAGGSAGPAALAMEVGIISFKAFAFLAGSLFLGLKFTPAITALVSKMRIEGMKLAYALMFAFLMSYLANVIGLAPIVGAFAAGLILDDVHFKNFPAGGHGHGDGDGHGHTMSVEELVAPIAALLVPIFFIQMGVQVKLETFTDLNILGVAAGLTIAAIIGKQVCSLVVREEGLSKISVGVGMVPRGEVGLIFASIGKELPPINGVKIIDDATFSAVVIMVIVTTLVTPPLLKFFMARHYDGSNTAAAS
ncbi:MAG: sodium:proton antiporter [Myxococcales bacterium]|nr:sodium:proton antiporter [Myxococcales bacterium]